MGGGTLVIGVHDGDLKIVGVNPLTKSYDSYMLTLDTILHAHTRTIRSRENPGGLLPAATITTSCVTCANATVLLLVHARDVARIAGQYMT